jgi:hypothetical protein
LRFFLWPAAWWTYHAFDQGVSLTYAKVSSEDDARALDDTLALMPMILAGDTSQNTLLDHLESKAGVEDAFEKDGCFWTGRIGLKFDEDRRLTEVRRGWE